jgi:hypothetical protein
MNKKTKISEGVIYEMHNFLEKEKVIGKAAKPEDLYFITEGAWLKDSAVIDAISYYKGGWDVLMIFAHYKNPLQLIVRNITRCYSEHKAKAAAFYIRKEAAKDRRGTLNVSIQNLGLCTN